eukprot:Gb_18118 [translate_table: standard]
MGLAYSDLSSPTCLIMDSEDDSRKSEMELIGKLLSFASKGDRIGLNQMLLEGVSPDIQDYDKRTALHLAASEGHASIVELLLAYKAKVNPKDRWKRTPLTDAKRYEHKDICRILEANGGKDTIDEQTHSIQVESPACELEIDLSELYIEQTTKIDQGSIGTAEKVKWRGTWVVKITIDRGNMVIYDAQSLFTKELSLLRKLRHPNIVQFLGAIIQGDQMIILTEYLPKGSLYNILKNKNRLDLQSALRFSLDIARGMNYLHEHKPNPIVHCNLCPSNLLQDEAGHLKVGEFWLGMLQEASFRPIVKKDGQMPNRSQYMAPEVANGSYDTKVDVFSFAHVFYEMLEGLSYFPNMQHGRSCEKMSKCEVQFKMSKCPKKVKELIHECLDCEPSKRPAFNDIIKRLEEITKSSPKSDCVLS